jgi:hypothetical protein
MKDSIGIVTKDSRPYQPVSKQVEKYLEKLKKTDFSAYLFFMGGEEALAIGIFEGAEAAEKFLRA